MTKRKLYIYYMAPRKRYYYWTPKVLKRSKHTHSGKLGERTSPFISVWYCGEYRYVIFRFYILFYIKYNFFDSISSKYTLFQAYIFHFFFYCKTIYFKLIILKTFALFAVFGIVEDICNHIKFVIARITL